MRLRALLAAVLGTLLLLAPATSVVQAQATGGTLLPAGQQLTPALKVSTDQAVYAPYQKIAVQYSGMTAQTAAVWIEPASVPAGTNPAGNMQFMNGAQGTLTFDGFATPGTYAVRVMDVRAGDSPVLVYEYDFTVGTAPQAAGGGQTGTAGNGTGPPDCPTGATGTLLPAGQQLTPSLKVWTDQAVLAPYQTITVHYSGMTAQTAAVWIEAASVPAGTNPAANMQFMNGAQGTLTFDGFDTAGRYAIRVMDVRAGDSPVLVYEYDFTVGAAAQAVGGKGNTKGCGPAPATRKVHTVHAGKPTAAGRRLTPALKVWTSGAAYAPGQKIVVHYKGMPATAKALIWIVPASAPVRPRPTGTMQLMKSRGTATFAGLSRPGTYAVRVMVMGAKVGTLVYEVDFRVRTAVKAKARNGAHHKARSRVKGA